MLLGFIATAIGFVFLPLGILIGFGAHILLSYILWVAKTLAYVPLASLEVGWFSVGVAVIYYVGLVFVLTRRRLKKDENENFQK